jgi:peptide/nickel transport system substrate-binding protein
VSITYRRRRYRWLPLLAAVSLILAACSDEDVVSSADPTAPASDVDPNGILRIGMDLVTSSGVGVNFDPATAGATSEAYDGLKYVVFGRLMRPNADGSLTPELAESATVVDKNTIEIVVRDGVTFSDGSAFDAAAVKAALDRAVANRATNETGFRVPFFSLTGTEVTAPNTVELSFGDGSAPSWYDTYMPGWETTITKPGETNWSAPIGAGPMKIASFKPGDSITLTKNESYFDADEIEVAGLEVVHVPNDQPASGVAAVQAGQLDVTRVEPAQLASATGSLETLSLVKPGSTVGMHICKAEPPLSDPRVRQAINKGIDRDAISDAIYGGQAAPQTQIWPPGHKFNSPELDDTLAYDVEGAKKLLAEAGYSGGFDLDLYSLPHFGLPEVSEVFKEQMAELGINVSYIAGADYLSQFLTANARGVGLFPGSSSGLAALTAWSGEGLGNICDYNNQELNGLIAELKTVSSSQPEAEELWHQVNELVVDQALSGFVLFRPNIVIFDSERVDGVTLWPLGNHLMPDITTTYVRAG